MKWWIQLGNLPHVCMSLSPVVLMRFSNLRQRLCRELTTCRKGAKLPCVAWSMERSQKCRPVCLTQILTNWQLLKRSGTKTTLEFICNSYFIQWLWEMQPGLLKSLSLQRQKANGLNCTYFRLRMTNSYLVGSIHFQLLFGHSFGKEEKNNFWSVCFELVSILKSTYLVRK